MQAGKRIALLIHALDGGGAEKLMSHLAARWSDRHEVHLITWSSAETDHYPLPASVVRSGLELQRPSRNAVDALLANFRRMRTLRSHLKKIVPDIVLSFSDQMNILSLEATRPLPVPHVIAEHSNPAEQQLGTAWEAWRRRCYPRCATCVVLTQSIEDYMTRWIPADRIQVIPPAFDEHQCCGESINFQARLEAKTLLYVGRLSPEKRVDRLLRLWHAASPDLPGWTLRIVGDGSERPALERLAAGMSGVEFCGWQADPTESYHSATALILTSDYEGFPVTILEGLSHGVPAISTSCCSAFEELNSNEEVVSLFGGVTATDMATELTRWLTDSTRLERMSKSAIRVARRYQWDRIGQDWDRLLESKLIRTTD